MIKTLDEAAWLELNLKEAEGKTAPECLLGVRDTYFVRNALNWPTIIKLYNLAREQAYFGAIWRFLEYHGILHTRHLDRIEQAFETGKKFRGRPPVPANYMGGGVIDRRTLYLYKLDLEKKAKAAAEKEKAEAEKEAEPTKPEPKPELPSPFKSVEAAVSAVLSVTTAKSEEPMPPENIEELSKKLAALKQAIKGSNTAVLTATQVQGSLLDVPKIAPPPPPPNPKDQLKDLRSKLLIQRGYGTAEAEK